MSYIYLIQSLNDGYYKIGFSKSPSLRTITLQTGNPSEIKLITTYKSEFATKIEATLKRKYNYLKKTGEWFDLSIDIEVNFTHECKTIENNINILRNSGNVFI